MIFVSVNKVYVSGKVGILSQLCIKIVTFLKYRT